MNVTAIVLTKNEEENIEYCLKSLKYCREIIVLDDYSTDKTTQIAKSMGATVIQHKLNNNFSDQRNYALTQAKSKWVLFIDADERVTKKLLNEIKKAVKEKSVDGYMIKREDIWLGKHLRHGEFGQTCLLRLAGKTKGKWVRAVHEHWFINGKVKTLKSPLYHYPHKTVSKFVSHVNKYSVLHAYENHKEGKTANTVKLYIFPLGKFIFNFFVRGGYKDGTHGFVAAILMSFHSFLSWHILWLQKSTGSKYS